MKIKLSAHLLNPDDAEYQEDGKPVVIQTALKRAIIADVNPDGTPIKVEDKLKRFDTYLKLNGASDETEWTIEEVALLDRAIGVYPTFIFGQLHYLLQNGN